MDNVDWLIVISIFFGYALVDGMYAYYTIAVIKKRAFSAASISFVMHFILAAGVFAYTRQFLYVLPLAFGSFVGTYLVTRFQKKLFKNDKL